MSKLGKEGTYWELIKLFKLEKDKKLQCCLLPYEMRSKKRGEGGRLDAVA